MPIKGLTGESFDINKAMPRFGKLRKGGEKRERTKNGRKYEIFGEDLDYFRLDLEPEYEHLRPVFEQLYGKQPQRFDDAFFYTNDVDAAFGTWYEEWGGGETLIRRCDGNRQHLHYNRDTGKWSQAKIDCQELKPNEGCQSCNRVGRLSFALWGFLQATNEMGYFTVETHSIHDIVKIYAGLRFARASAGMLAGIRFVLGRREKTVSTPLGGGKRGTTEKSLIYMHVHADDAHRVFFPNKTQTGAAQLESGDSEPDMQTLRNALGAGNTRRIDTGVNSKSQPEPAPEPDEPIDYDPVTGEILAPPDGDAIEGEIIEDTTPQPEPGTFRYLAWEEFNKQNPNNEVSYAAFDHFMNALRDAREIDASTPPKVAVKKLVKHTKDNADFWLSKS